MTRNEIEVILSLSTPEINVRNFSVAMDPWARSREPANDTPEGRRTLENDPSLGWQFATRVATSGYISPRDKRIEELYWVNAAVSFLTHEQHEAKSPADFVSEAGLLDTCFTGRALRACLLATDASVELVATALNLPLDTVSAYHSLFFNVVGRREDVEFMQGLEGMHTSVSFAHEQAGLASGDPLLRVARTGTVEDVLVAAGLRHGHEETRAELVEMLQLVSLKAAAEWFSCPGNVHKEIPASIGLGLHIAKETELPAEAESSGGFSMSSLISAQLDRDAETVRRSMDQRAAAHFGQDT